MAVCPGCRKYSLTFGDRIALTGRFYTPWYCPNCGQAFVNAPWATIGSGLLAMLVMVVSTFAIGPFVTKDQLIWTLVGLVALAVPMSVLIMRPIPYADFRMYGKRAWWKAALIFVVFPLALMFLVLCLLIQFKVGL